MSTRSAVITGGASGIGEASARRLAADGYDIWILDAARDRAEAVAADIRATGRRAAAMEVDVADADALEACARHIIKETGAPSALVTSAGILHSAETLLDMDLDSHDRMWRVNYHGTVHACRSFGRQMLERGGGTIVTVGSINSFGALPLPAYCPGKTAILRLTEILAVELGRNGVRVNGVAPTYVLTPALQARIDAGERDPAAIRSSGALDMFVMPAHIADAVAFLCSDQAAAITGVMLPVDAGWCAATPYKSYTGGLPWNDQA